jgi:hypothetical protein
MGELRHMTTWVDSHVIVQCYLVPFVLSIVAPDTANLGIIEEQIPIISDAMLPLCSESKEQLDRA